MLISELSFPHLREAHDARLEQQLEQRRVALERQAESRSRSIHAHAGRARGDSSERMSQHAVDAKDAVACPA